MDHNTTARDVFMYLLVLIVLSISAANLGTLLFQYVNIYVPDAALQQCYGTSCSDAIRWSLASLIVVFSVLIWARRFIQRDISAHPEKAQLGIRRWAFYLTIFVSGGFLIGDAIALLYSWLNGDLTVQFILKAVAVLYIAGTILYYFLKQLHPEEKSYASVVVWIAAVVVLASVILGFTTAGSPFRARDERLDSRRITDLQTIQYQIVNYWQSKGVLPDTLSQLEDPISGFMIPVDPQSKESYEYSRKDATSFVLCGEFLTAQDLSDPYQRTEYFGYPVSQNETWSHTAGRSCFDRVIDPDFYPVNPKPAL